jgi:UDP-glucuronate 4-epimerase
LPYAENVTLKVSLLRAAASNNYQMRAQRVLITGGAGFIGSHLTERLLSDGWQVTIFDDFNDAYDPQIKRQNLAGVLENVELIEGDIRDAVLVERAFMHTKFDMVVHLAARAGVRPSIQHPKLYMTTNIEGTFNLVDACRHHEVRNFVFASSSSVYGVNRKVPFAESDPIERTISPYAATKLACEQICSNYSHLFDMRSRCLRFFTVYGPRQRPDLAIAQFTRAILDDKIVKRFGNGETRRDYTYVDDIIEGIVRSFDDNGSNFEVLNLGGSTTTRLLDLIEMLENLLGKKARIEELEEQLGDVPLTHAEIGKARELLGWEPKVGIRDGLSKYVEWVQHNQLAGCP